MPGLFQRVKQWFTGSPARQAVAKVDAASTSDENRKHWANADNFGPNAAMDSATRARCRSRGRYEAMNNGYCRGLVRSHAYDLVGTCPRLQLSLPDDEGSDESKKATAANAKRIERLYAQWARATKLGRKLRILEKCAARDGGGFLIADTNDALDNPVKLDYRGVEDEQCQTPLSSFADPYMIDGIKIDEAGHPISYTFLTYHPGEYSAAGWILSGGDSYYLTLPAKHVIHWYEQDRFGQVKGLPRITASLPLFAQLRRFTLATLTAAEIAAMLAGIMKTDLPPDAPATQVSDWSMYELVRGALLSLPAGWEATQFNATQPQTTYGDFKREILNEGGRGSGAPLNIVSGNSSQYNFSSGRLDHLPYQRGMEIERYDFRDIVLDPIFLGWHAEARLIAGYLPADLPPLEEWSWDWNYDGFGSVDPTKDSAAKDQKLKNGTATYASVYAEDGIDWQDAFDQLAREREYALSKGLPWPLLFNTPASATAEEPEPQEREQIKDALETAGLDEAKADETTDLLLAWFGRGNPANGYRNGHLNGGGVK